MKKLSTLFLMTLLAASLHAQRSEYLLEKNWKFMKGGSSGSHEAGI